jgi:hypothetical protein
MSKNDGKTVAEILSGKKASIKQAALDPGSPSWDDILDWTWEEIERRARLREPGFQTISKLLKDGRFDK